MGPPAVSHPVHSLVLLQQPVDHVRNRFDGLGQPYQQHSQEGGLSVAGTPTDSCHDTQGQRGREQPHAQIVAEAKLTGLVCGLDLPQFQARADEHRRGQRHRQHEQPHQFRRTHLGQDNQDAPLASGVGQVGRECPRKILAQRQRSDNRGDRGDRGSGRRDF